MTTGSFCLVQVSSTLTLHADWSKITITRWRKVFRHSTILYSLQILQFTQIMLSCSWHPLCAPCDTVYFCNTVFLFKSVFSWTPIVKGWTYILKRIFWTFLGMLILQINMYPLLRQMCFWVLLTRKPVGISMPFTDAQMLGTPWKSTHYSIWMRFFADRCIAGKLMLQLKQEPTKVLQKYWLHSNLLRTELGTGHTWVTYPFNTPHQDSLRPVCDVRRYERWRCTVYLRCG